MHDKKKHNNIIILLLINVSQNNNNIIISKTKPFFKIKFSSWFEFNNESNNCEYAAEYVNILIIIFSRSTKITLLLSEQTISLDKNLHRNLDQS
jgi:hypothetical protein